MKKMLIAAAIMITMGSCTAMAEETVLIDGFRDYKWGTSSDIIKDAEITADMQENRDYVNEPGINDSEIDVFSILDGSVAGYDARISYCFADGKLTGGIYELDVEKTEEERAYNDLKDKYSGIYGEPVAATEGTGWGPFTLWIDDDKNLIYFDAWFDIGYLQAGSPLLEVIDIEGTEKYFGINILDELEKIGNTDGI